MSSNLRIVLISLAGSARRDRASENLNALSIPWTFFDALREPAPGLPQYDIFRALRFWGRGLSKSEIGCAASHMSVMADSAKLPMGSWTLVVEDDVLLDPDFNYGALVSLCEAANIGYLRLFARHLAPSRHVTRLGHRELIRFERAPMGTQAYLISSSAARGFIDGVRTIDRPIDWEMDRFWANGLLNYALFPFPCFELALQSSIRKAPDQPGEPTMFDRIAWFAWKSKEYIRRWLKNIYLRQNDTRIRRLFANSPIKF
jgi:GR25 family glycosyltransferase involved in LPS biosynthesis